MTAELKIPLYPKQINFLKDTSPFAVFMAGRGSAKSTSIGWKNAMRMQDMPRAKGFLAAKTYNTVLTKSLPVILQAFAQMGYVEGVHFVIGKRPPKHFDSPYLPPKKYENILTFDFGYTIEMISLDRFQNARGGSYDFGDIDEIGGLGRDAFTDVLVPSMRGNTHVFNSPYHHQICAYTSVPWVSKGNWILDYEQKAQSEPEHYGWHEATAYDNPHIPISIIKRWEREMPYLKFQIEVLNRRIRKVDLPFYNKLNESKHLFTPTYEYGFDEKFLYGKTTGYKQYNPDAPLDLSFDFGGHINVVLVIQRNAKTEYILADMYKLNENSLGDLLKAFADKYATHRAKTVYVYGEPRGHDPKPEGKRLYEFIQSELRKLGWTVIVKVKQGYKTEDHINRREYINNILEEGDSRLPHIRINEEECKHLHISMQAAGTLPDGRKDKSAEKDPSFPQQEATHASDAFDYFIMQKYSNPKAKTRRGAGTARIA